jgi:hypothetical protein
VKKDLRKGEKAEQKRLGRIGQLGNDPLDKDIKGNCQKKKRNKSEIVKTRKMRHIYTIFTIDSSPVSSWLGWFAPTPKTGVRHWHPAVIPTI